MKLKVYYNITLIKKFWDRLSKSNRRLTPFQYYNYNRNLYLDRWLNVFNTHKIPVFLTVWNYGDVIMIAPLLKTLRNNYFMLGDVQGCGVTDFIYSQGISQDQISEAVSLIMKYCKRIHIGRFSDSSYVFRQFEQYLTQDVIENETLVNISFGECYEEYFSKLSKHTRQNIRTSYNRLKNNNIEFSFEFLTKDCINNKIWSQINEVYCKRQIDMYGASGKSLKLKNKFVKHDSLSLRYNENAVVGILRYNDNIAAVLMGLKNNENSCIVVPRLAINDEFAYYSPGNQLINETIKYLISNTSICNLDLSRGVEKYKFMMGGTEYYTKSFVVSI